MSYGLSAVGDVAFCDTDKYIEDFYEPAFIGNVQ